MKQRICFILFFSKFCISTSFIDSVPISEAVPLKRQNSYDKKALLNHEGNNQRENI